MTQDFPPEWVKVGRLAASLWQHQPWDGDVLVALLFLAQRRGVEVTPALVTDALLSWADDGGDHAHFAPTPGDVLERVREIEAERRPKLPPPPEPDWAAAADESYDRWAETATTEQVGKLRQARDRLQRVDATAPDAQEQRHRIVMDYLASRGAAAASTSLGGRPRAHLEAMARAAQERPITAEQIAGVEELVREGREQQVPERYRHLLPEIRARVQPRPPDPQAAGGAT